MQRPQTTPHTTVVLAMSADGKIADRGRSPARFGSASDKHHLETQIAGADGVLFGAGTLRAYGTTLSVTDPALLDQRQQQGKVAQPVHIVCSRSGNLDPAWRFFQQPVPRWLVTTAEGSTRWQALQPPTPVATDAVPAFERVLIPSATDTGLDWEQVFQELHREGLNHLVVTGGGTLVASLLATDLIDELWLTVCPLLLGGSDAPTPVDGSGFTAAVAPQLELIEVRAIASEVFLHYRCRNSTRSRRIVTS